MSNKLKHKSTLNPKSFTSKYIVESLLYYEHFGWIQKAIDREKENNIMGRNTKMELIKTTNPDFSFLNDLFL